MRAKYLRIAIGQVNPIVGDFRYNREKIISFIDRAIAERADLVVFPELVLTGYPPFNLLFYKSFLGRQLEELDFIREYTKGKDIVVILGYAEKEFGKIYNSLSVMYDGSIVAKHRKCLFNSTQPLKDEFYFSKGNSVTIVEFDSFRMGLVIGDEFLYHGELACRYRDLDCSVVVASCSFNYVIGEPVEKMEYMKLLAKNSVFNLVFVNLCGAQDEYVFYGGSFVVDSEGTLIARAPYFEEAFLVVDVDLLNVPYVRPTRCSCVDKSDLSVEIVRIEKTLPDRDGGISTHFKFSDVREIELIYKAIVTGVRDYFNKNNFKTAVIGLSGGIDSALTTVIAVDALGSKNVKAVIMPSRYTSVESLEDARQLANNLGIESIIFPIDPVVDLFMEKFSKIVGDDNGRVLENLQPRIRANILMALSNKYSWIVLNTGNKSEGSVGYCTLYGDSIGAYAPLKDVLKTMVYELARYRNTISPVIPERILIKPPSAELKPGQTDEADLAPYVILDEVVKFYVEGNRDVKDIISKGYDEALVRRIVNLIELSEFKRRQAPIGPKLTRVTFGIDRLVPITHRFRP
ncbi:MAG: NAD+ synthase [Thermosulfidibacteraceae bacterium]